MHVRDLLRILNLSLLDVNLEDRWYSILSPADALEDERQAGLRPDPLHVRPRHLRRPTDQNTLTYAIPYCHQCCRGNNTQYVCV